MSISGKGYYNKSPALCQQKKSYFRKSRINFVPAHILEYHTVKEDADCVKKKRPPNPRRRLPRPMWISTIISSPSSPKNTPATDNRSRVVADCAFSHRQARFASLPMLLRSVAPPSSEQSPLRSNRLTRFALPPISARSLAPPFSSRLHSLALTAFSRFCASLILAARRGVLRTSAKSDIVFFRKAVYNGLIKARKELL